MDNETNRTIESLLSECNRDESFRKSLVSLMKTETSHEFDLIVSIAKRDMSNTILPFINDLRALYEDPELRALVLKILDDEYAESKMRAVSYILNMHLSQIKRVENLRALMLKNARETIEQYVPAFEEVVTFLTRFEHEDLNELTPHTALSEVFYNELLESIETDLRVTGHFLVQVCRDEQFRHSLNNEIDTYPEVVQVLYRMSDSLLRAQRYLAEIEIDNLLHGIEENCYDTESSDGEEYQ